MPQTSCGFHPRLWRDFKSCVLYYEAKWSRNVTTFFLEHHITELRSSASLSPYSLHRKLYSTNFRQKIVLGNHAPRKKTVIHGLFSIQSEGLVCNQRACALYGIAVGVWHHASACIFLRIDAMHHFVMIPCRRQAADSIHAFGVILRVAFLLCF